MKSRTKDLIVLLAAGGSGLGTLIVLLALLDTSNSVSLTIGLAVFLFAVWKINNLMTEAIDRKCPSCDTLNTSESSYCSKCGTNLKNGIIAPPPPLPTPTIGNQST